MPAIRRKCLAIRLLGKFWAGDARDVYTHPGDSAYRRRRPWKLETNQ
jgi:hypothetical protein